jgi:hypothetical protein
MARPHGWFSNELSLVVTRAIWVTFEPNHGLQKVEALQNHPPHKIRPECLYFFITGDLLWHVWLAKFSRIRVGSLVQIHMTSTWRRQVLDTP